MSLIPKTAANFQSSLATGISATATSFTLSSITDAHGVVLANGTYQFTFNQGTPKEEHMIATITGTSASIDYRGINPQAPLTQVDAQRKKHGKNSPIIITNWPLLGIIRNILAGESGWTLPAVVRYASGLTPSHNDDIPHKSYVDGVALAGAPDANETTKGMVEEATQAETDAKTATGSTSAKLIVTPAKMRATKFQDYAADAGANDTYAITCSPVVTAYAAGQVFVFKANTANTGAATLNVDSLGAITIKKQKDVDLNDGDIKAGSIVTVVYDGTNFQLQSAIAKQPITTSGAEVYAADAGANDTYVITRTPAPAALVTGMVIWVKFNTANTGAATLADTGLAATTIVKGISTTLADGDIAAGSIHPLIYDGTNYRLIGPTDNAYTFGTLYASGVATHNSGSGNQTIAHSLTRIPKHVRITAVYSGANDLTSNSVGAAQSTSTENCVYTGQTGTDSNHGSVAGEIIHLSDGASAVIAASLDTLDITNIILAFGTDSATFDLLWEVWG